MGASTPLSKQRKGKPIQANEVKPGGDPVVVAPAGPTPRRSVKLVQAASVRPPPSLSQGQEQQHMPSSSIAKGKAPDSPPERTPEQQTAKQAQAQKESSTSEIGPATPPQHKLGSSSGSVPQQRVEVVGRFDRTAAVAAATAAALDARRTDQAGPSGSGLASSRQQAGDIAANTTTSIRRTAAEEQQQQQRQPALNHSGISLSSLTLPRPPSAPDRGLTRWQRISRKMFSSRKKSSVVTISAHPGENVRLRLQIYGAERGVVRVSDANGERILQANEPLVFQKEVKLYSRQNPNDPFKLVGVLAAQGQGPPLPVSNPEPQAGLATEQPSRYSVVAGSSRAAENQASTSTTDAQAGPDMGEQGDEVAKELDQMMQALETRVKQNEVELNDFNNDIAQVMQWLVSRERLMTELETRVGQKEHVLRFLEGELMEAERQQTLMGERLKTREEHLAATQLRLEDREVGLMTKANELSNWSRRLELKERMLNEREDRLNRSEQQNNATLRNISRWYSDMMQAGSIQASPPPLPSASLDSAIIEAIAATTGTVATTMSQA